MSTPSPGPDPVPLIVWVSAFGVLVNLGWNYINHLRTGQLKKWDARAEEFKRLRSRIEHTLVQIRSVQSDLRALSRSVSADEDWSRSLAEKNEALVHQYTDLSASLTDFDDSPFVSGNDWGSLTKADWDAAADAINGGYNPTLSLDKKREAVGRASRHIEDLVKTINRRLDEELKQYAAVKSRK